MMIMLFVIGGLTTQVALVGMGIIDWSRSFIFQSNQNFLLICLRPNDRRTERASERASVRATVHCCIVAAATAAVAVVVNGLP